jgi:hypothetical protein
VRAHVARLISSAADKIESDLRDAERKGLLELPSFDAQTTIEATMKSWDQNFGRVLNLSFTRRVDLDSSLLPEVLRRAVERVPPVSAAGREIRDAIIWLSLLSYIRTQKWPSEVAFVSLNTDDFAGTDKRTLRPELQADLTGIRGRIEYYPSIDSFIRDHAEPISYISKEWVESRLDMEEVKSRIQAHLERAAPALYFRPSDSDYRDYYDPNVMEVVYEPSVTLDDVYVWQIDSEQIEVFLDFTVEAEAEIECHLKGGPLWSRSVFSDYSEFDDGYRPYRSMTCFAELRASLAAIIKDGQLILGDIEEVERM